MGRSSFAIAVLPTVACFGAERTVRAEVGQLTVDGKSRTYVIERPNARMSSTLTTDLRFATTR